MEKILEFPNTIIVVTNGNLRFLLFGDPKLKEWMDGDLFEDNCNHDMNSFPTNPGIYRATVEYYFEQGYSDGYKADGESEWDFVCKDVVDITGRIIEV